MRTTQDNPAQAIRPYPPFSLQRPYVRRMTSHEPFPRSSFEFMMGAMTSHDIGRMMKRYLRRAGLPPHLSPHSFRVTTITDLLDQSLPLEDVQDLTGHADPRTTRLYDRSKRAMTRNIVERIRIGR